jgi:hypothetical protein
MTDLMVAEFAVRQLHARYVDAQLRFKWRLFQLYYLGTMDITTRLFENPEFGAPPAMPPLDAPTYDHSGLSTDRKT